MPKRLACGQVEFIRAVGKVNFLGLTWVLGSNWLGKSTVASSLALISMMFKKPVCCTSTVMTSFLPFV